MLFERRQTGSAPRFLRNALGVGTALVLLAMPLAAPVSAAPAGPAETKVVATGLDNPRGLDFGLLGALYVAEAGKGGDGPCLPSPEGGNACYGRSGAITRVLNGRQERIAKNLPSLAAEGGTNAIGPHAVSAVIPGDIQAAIGWGYTLDQRTQFARTANDPRINNMGRLVRVLPSGSVQSLADLMAFEHANNPDKKTGAEGENSDPFGLLGGVVQQYVADAGGNDLLSIGPGGRVSTVAVFPQQTVPGPGGVSIPMDAVPTSVVRGPDGALYVGQLTGFPFPEGGASVYRVAPGHAPKPYASGFTNIIGLTFAPNGTLYVLEISSTGLASGQPPFGALYSVDRRGNKTLVDTSSHQLFAPGGITLGPDGALYVTNNSVLPGQGEVVRIKP